MDQDATWYGGRPQPRGLCVRWGPSSPSQKGGGARGQGPQFSDHVYCGQTAGWIKMTLGMEVGRPWSSPHYARWGHSSPLQKRGRAPQFSTHLYCGQTVGCIKMSVCMEVGLIPGVFVLDGDPALLHTKGYSSLPNFRPISIVAKRLDASACHLVQR